LEDTTGSWQFCVGADFGFAGTGQNEETVEGAERIEGWTGPVSLSRQTIIEPGDSANYHL
jgi:hypothetical protein